MPSTTSKQNQRLAQVVEQRVGKGPSDMVTGWQSMLIELLNRMKTYLKPGAAVTFQQLMPKEIEFFQQLSDGVTVPPGAVALFLPPSVRHQMMGGRAGDFNSAGIADAGVLVASHHENHDIIVNALFAHPPFTAAVDVYDQGQLVAGYQYDAIDACRIELGQILNRHLAALPADSSTG